MDADPPVSLRVTRIKVIADLFFQGSGGGPTNIATDLLADLQHWCVHNDVQFDEALTEARRHYLFEQAQESGVH